MHAGLRFHDLPFEVKMVFLTLLSRQLAIEEEKLTNNSRAPYKSHN